MSRGRYWRRSAAPSPRNVPGESAGPPHENGHSENPLARGLSRPAESLPSRAAKTAFPIHLFTEWIGASVIVSSSLIVCVVPAGHRRRSGPLCPETSRRRIRAVARAGAGFRFGAASQLIECASSMPASTPAKRSSRRRWRGVTAAITCLIEIPGDRDRPVSVVAGQATASPCCARRTPATSWTSPGLRRARANPESRNCGGSTCGGQRLSAQRRVRGWEAAVACWRNSVSAARFWVSDRLA